MYSVKHLLRGRQVSLTYVSLQVVYVYSFSLLPSTCIAIYTRLRFTNNMPCTCIMHIQAHFTVVFANNLAVSREGKLWIRILNQNSDFLRKCELTNNKLYEFGPDVNAFKTETLSSPQVDFEKPRWRLNRWWCRGHDTRYRHRWIGFRRFWRWVFCKKAAFSYLHLKLINHDVLPTPITHAFRLLLLRRILQAYDVWMIGVHGEEMTTRISRNFFEICRFTQISTMCTFITLQFRLMKSSALKL